MKPEVIAHRGDSGERPENTLSAFASALDLGVPAIELDVQLTRDGQLVVLHDGTLDRTTSGTGPVADGTLAEIRALSAGYRERFGAAFASERVPTLVEVLDLARGRARVLVEIKGSAAGGGDDRLERSLVASVRDAGMAGDVALICFDGAALAACRTHAPQLMRGLLAHDGDGGRLVAAARALECALVLPWKEMLDDQLCSTARAAGLGVATWVVDQVEELEELARFDLDGVGSNRPGALLSYLASRAAREMPRP
jgi:glycerophosphoryl diester phosphodiesterase